jgi:hypothetical protein
METQERKFGKYKFSAGNDFIRKFIMEIYQKNIPPNCTSKNRDLLYCLELDFSVTNINTLAVLLHFYIKSFYIHVYLNNLLFI